MKNNVTRLAAALLLMLAAAVIVSGLPGVSATTGPAREDGACAAAAAGAGAGQDAVGPTQACRRAPECEVDSDCDLLCGIGLGKCVHSSCPVRICKCH